VAALLGQVGWGEVDGDPCPRQPEPDRVQRIAHPLATLGDRLVGQADDREVMLSRCDLNFDLNRPRLDADERDR